jgi:acyl-CoA ligase (AMP-forming) (exosortase A-associated)
VQAPDDTAYPLDHLALRGERDALALIDRHGALDYLGLDRAVGALARALVGRGLAKGDRVASWLAKTRLACLLPLACARAGLVHVPINPLLKHAQAAHILADSGARLLIAGAGRAGTLEKEDRPAECSLLIEDEKGALTLHETSKGLPASEHDPDDLAAILYTSGSTGRPKGVMLSHANLWLGAVSVAHYLKLGPADRTLCVLPFSFDYGQNQLLSAWASGGAAIPLDFLTARDVIRAVDLHEATTLAGVPPLWVQLAEAEWPRETAARLRRLTNSGGRMSVSLVRRLRALFPQADLYSMYGLTEAFRSTWLDPGLIDAHPDAIGDAIPFAEVMVVGADGNPAVPGEPGELVHAGPLVAKGYWKDPLRTAERFRPAPTWSAEGGTAVWSGDTVVRGQDGLLRFVGRDDEMIKSSGNRISPTEIEEAAIASGVVTEAVALGVADERLGQAILLVLRGDASGEAALRDHLRRELPNFMQPRAFDWREELPRNANGKLDRAAIKAELAS